MTYAQYGRLWVHVSASARTVIRKARNTMLSKHAKRRDMRTMRHAWLREILKHHEAERELCRRWRF